MNNSSRAWSRMDMRDAFFDSLCALASENRDILILTGDHTAFSLQRFAAEHPEQVINVGIAEQNLISVAAGLAHAGKKPFVYGINNFVSMRVLEHISVDVAAMELPVAIVGVGAGFTYSFDGPTHHGIQDLAAMAAIPKLSIWNASDARQSWTLAEMAVHRPGVKYLRIEKDILPLVYDKRSPCLDQGLELLRDGSDLTLVASGMMVSRAMEVAASLEKRGISAAVVDLFRVKPLNTALLDRYLQGKKLVVSIEENLLIGGIGERIAVHLAEKGSNIRLLRKGIDDQFCFEYGERHWLHALYGLDRDNLSCTVELAWKNAR